MIKWIKKIFSDKQCNDTELDDTELDKLKEVWDNLDPKLQACAKESFDIGKGRNKRSHRLNEVGMSQLILHLDRHGFEIRKKES